MFVIWLVDEDGIVVDILEVHDLLVEDLNPAKISRIPRLYKFLFLFYTPRQISLRHNPLNVDKCAWVLAIHSSPGRRLSFILLLVSFIFKNISTTCFCWEICPNIFSYFMCETVICDLIFWPIRSEAECVWAKICLFNVGVMVRFDGQAGVMFRCDGQV